MLFDNRWNQHTYTSLTLLPFGLWTPGNYNHWQYLDVVMSDLCLMGKPCALSTKHFQAEMGSLV